MVYEGAEDASWARVWKMTMATASLSHNSDQWACPPGALLEGSGAALVAKERRQDRGASAPQRQPEGGAGVFTGQDLSSTDERSLTGLRVTLHKHLPAPRALHAGFLHSLFKCLHNKTCFSNIGQKIWLQTPAHPQTP